MAIEKVMPRVDVERCIELFDNEQYSMILVAANRARELHSKKNIAERDSGRLIRTGYKPVSAALNEIIEGKLTPAGLKQD